MLLGRLRVRQKLVLLIVPLLLLAVAGAIPLVLSRVQAAERSSDSAKLVQRAVRITELVQELQQERLASLGYLSNDVARDDVVARSTRVLELAHQIDTDYGDGDDKLALQLRQVTLRSALDGLRPQILEQRIAGIGVYTGFTGVIGGLLDQLRLTNDADLRSEAGRQQVALDAIIRHDEATAAEGAALFIEPGRRITMRVVGLVGGGLALENREETVFKQLADPSAADLYERVEASRSSSRLNNYLDGLVGSNATQISATIAGDLAPQVQSLTSLSRLVETRVAAQAVAAADRSARTDRWLAGIVGGVALVLLVGAALLSVLITRSIARPLRRLTASRTRSPTSPSWSWSGWPTPTTPGGRGAAAAAGPGRHSRRARRAGHGVQPGPAGRVQPGGAAAGQPAERGDDVRQRRAAYPEPGRPAAGDDRLAGAQRAGPGALDRLYRLDHVSTRLRRNANSLVVLSGPSSSRSPASRRRSPTRSARRWARSRASSGSGSADRPRRYLAPSALADVILLLAELLENGTSFSPPHTEVEVEAQSDDDSGVPIRIVDHGLGMPPGAAGGGERPARSPGSGSTWRRPTCSGCSWSAGWRGGTGSMCGSWRRRVRA